jgi:hypothetical protein
MSAAASATLFVAACGGSTATTASSTPEPVTAAPTEQATPEPVATVEPSTEPSAAASFATTGRIVDAENGFAITLPEGWQRLSLTEEDLDLFFRTGVEMMSPEAAGLLEGQVRSMLTSGIKFFAMDMEGLASGAANNLNVIATPSGGVSIDLLEQIVVGQLEATFPDLEGDIESERVTLPAGDALHISYSVDTDAPDGTKLDLTIHQFLVEGDGTAYYVTVTGPSTDEFAAQALEIAESLELVN